eukprot:3711540-Prymnesium_polylepis.1
MDAAGSAQTPLSRLRLRAPEPTALCALTAIVAGGQTEATSGVWRRQAASRRRGANEDRASSSTTVRVSCRIFNGQRALTAYDHRIQHTTVWST